MTENFEERVAALWVALAQSHVGGYTRRNDKTGKIEHVSSYFRHVDGAKLQIGDEVVDSYGKAHVVKSNNGSIVEFKDGTSKSASASFRVKNASTEKPHSAFGTNPKYNPARVFDGNKMPVQAPPNPEAEAALVNSLKAESSNLRAEDRKKPAPEVPSDHTMAPDKTIDTKGWKKQPYSQGGSNPGGVYTAPDGSEYYGKESKSADHARNEVLARKLYDEAGIPSAQLALADINGKIGTVSPLIPGAKQDLKQHLKDSSYIDKLREGFAVDAWLANWDVAGLVYDNVVTDSSGEPVRVDPGGALTYRAMGAPKGGAFGNSVGELNTLRDSYMNNVSASIFGDITDDQLKSSAARVAAISPDKIDSIVDTVGFNKPEADAMKSKLKARRADLLENTGVKDPFSTNASDPLVNKAQDNGAKALKEAEAKMQQQLKEFGAPDVAKKDTPTHHVANPAATPAKPHYKPKKISPAEREARSIKAAEDLYAKASSAEPGITAALKAASNDIGFKLVGLDNRLKTVDSMARKIAKRSGEKNISPEAQAPNIIDTLRYTVTDHPDYLVDSSDRTLSRLEAQGHTVTSLRNSWGDGNAYQGIHAIMRTPDGLEYEIQFHTPESYKVKEANHKDFEILRNMEFPLHMRRAAWQRMMNSWLHVVRPKFWNVFGSPQHYKAPLSRGFEEFTVNLSNEERDNGA